MPIQKQEFYEGAALHSLARSGKIQNIKYEAPFFLLNDDVLVHLKYSTKNRSPWSFTFTAGEQALLADKANQHKTVIGLVCGSDGIAAFTFEDYCNVAVHSKSAIRIACYRSHREHYQIKGPDGTLGWKVPPSDWQRILQ